VASGSGQPGICCCSSSKKARFGKDFADIILLIRLLRRRCTGRRRSDGHWIAEFVTGSRTITAEGRIELASGYQRTYGKVVQR